MLCINTYLGIIIAAILLVPFISVKWKGIVTVSAVILNAVLGGYIAIDTLLGNTKEFVIAGSFVTGDIPIRIDALSAWFILLINFSMITGALYGLQYMKSYKEQSPNIALHCIAYMGIQTALTAICIIQNTIVFLFAWEIMAISSFLLIIFEHYKQDVIKAGINYLIQAHISIVLLYVGFIWVASRMNSYDFNAIAEFTASSPSIITLTLFLCFFIAFAIKAGFVPFHTWLPYAHPAAPSHVSGIMSGVIIKIGIYGILRMILLVKTDYIVVGFIILFISVISGVYGVMLATLQHNLKKLLAYHSIENIGIIGIGIGLGTIGIGVNNYFITMLGFAGAMLHVLNHSLFKSLLFYGAGNVYQSTHTLNIEHLGGLAKKMPHSAILFLVAALAICGLPPFNGFVSEFIIYSGLFNGLSINSKAIILFLIFSISGLVIIGGLAMLCFTKAFGTVFLGTSHHHFRSEPMEANTGKLFPMYMVMVLIIAIGLVPSFFLRALTGSLALFTGKLVISREIIQPVYGAVHTLQYIGWCSMGFILLACIIFFIRQKMLAKRPIATSTTWGCGYTGETIKMQYTASSFVRSYRKLAEPLLSLHKKKKDIKDIFPTGAQQEIHVYDKIEEWLIDMPLRQMKYFFGRFQFLQNGNPQFYIMYGFVFIVLILSIPALYGALKLFIEFLSQL